MFSISKPIWMSVVCLSTAFVVSSLNAAVAVKCPVGTTYNATTKKCVKPAGAPAAVTAVKPVAPVVAVKKSKAQKITDKLKTMSCADLKASKDQNLGISTGTVIDPKTNKVTKRPKINSKDRTAKNRKLRNQIIADDVIPAEMATMTQKKCSMK